MGRNVPGLSEAGGAVGNVSHALSMDKAEKWGQGHVAVGKIPTICSSPHPSPGERPAWDASRGCQLNGTWDQHAGRSLFTRMGFLCSWLCPHYPPSFLQPDVYISTCWVQTYARRWDILESRADMVPDLMVFPAGGEDRQLRKQSPFRVASAMTRR